MAVRRRRREREAHSYEDSTTNAPFPLCGTGVGTLPVRRKASRPHPRKSFLLSCFIHGAGRFDVSEARAIMRKRSKR